MTAARAGADDAGLAVAGGPGLQPGQRGRAVGYPITHACWAGLTGYFIGLAATGRHKWYTVSWIGLVIAAILHGLNDWSRVNGQWLWIVVTIVSGILFLGYAKVGSRSDQEVPGRWPPERPPAAVAGAARPWWEH